MKSMLYVVGFLVSWLIMISQVVIGFILGIVWAFLDEYCTKNEGNSFLRKVYCWFGSIINHKFALLICQMIIIAAVLSILSIIF